MDAGVLGVVVGQFGLLLGFMVFLMRRMDRLEERLSAKIDRSEERLEKKIDDLAQEVAGLRERMANIEGQMEMLRELLIRLQTGERPAEEPQPA